MTFTELQPDDDGKLLVRIKDRNYSVEQDGDGQLFLCEILPYEDLPEGVRSSIESGETHPERWVRNRPRRRAS